MQVNVPLISLKRVLIASVVVLTICGFAAEVAHNLLYLDDPFRLHRFFGLSYEHNLPTWFSSCLLFSSAFVLALIASGSGQCGAPYTKHWWGMSVVFLYISLDEMAQLHENATWFHTNGGLLYFSWVIPGALAVTLFGIFYLGFLIRLPSPFRNRLILAGSIYVTGALLMELPLGYWKEQAGSGNFIYGMIDLIEESMEMTGASIFLFSLVEYLTSPFGDVRVSVRPQGG